MSRFVKVLSFMLTFFIIFTSSTCVLASNSVSATASFNPADGSVTVSGSSQGNTTIYVLPVGTSVNDVTISNLYTHFDQISAEDLPYTFTMPDWAPYGKYNVTILAGDSAGDTFMYYDPLAADTLIATLNLSSSGTQLANAINQNAAALGIDLDNEFVSSNLTGASLICYAAFMPFSNSNDFYSKFNACLAMADMKGAGRAEIENLISGYSQHLGISYPSDYEVLSDAVANDVCMLISSMDFAAEYKVLNNENQIVSFKNLLKRTSALSSARLAQSWSELKKVFDTDCVSELSQITSSNTSYNSSLATNTFKSLISKKPFTSFSDLKSKFNAAVSEAIIANKPQSKPTSGVGGFVSTPSGFTNPTDQYEEIKQNNDVDGGKKTSISKPSLNNERADYSDVPVNTWEYDAVSILGANGVISGYEDGSFRSSSPITRAEFSKLVVAAFNIDAEPVLFKDVNESDWYYPYVSVAAGSGIINGYNGSFNPDLNITREDAAVIIYRASELLKEDFSGSASFIDMMDVSIYAMPAVRSLGNAGIIKGDNDSRFNPRAELTRAEAAQLLYNFINALTK